MRITLDQLVENLSSSGLMAADEAVSLCEGLSTLSGPSESDTVVQELVGSGKLTAYQAECVCRGETSGLVFDEYLVLDKIGQGGMGVVLKAQHRRMNRIVAVKKLPTEALESEDAVKRFYREVEAAARLMHPNVVAALDAREHEGVHYLVMEFVEGQDLAEILKEHGPLPVEEAVGYIVQASQGLEYAHKRGIVHRDIKPANLLLDTEGTVKILDMGLARIAAEAGDGDAPDQLTTSGQVMGTCDYMAPEQAEDTHSVDYRADIYALGCTLYRLLTGNPLYTGSTLMKVLLAHREAEIPSLTEKRADVPASVDAVFQKMVAKQPDDRYATMAEVTEALQAALGRGPAPAPEPDSGLMDFLQQMPTVGSGRGSGKTVTAKETATAKQKTAAAVEETIDHVSQADTDPNTVTQLSAPSPRRSAARRKQRQMLMLIGIGIGLSLIGAAVVAVVVYVQTNRGTIIVDARDADIQVSVQRGGDEVDVIDASDHWRIEAKAGKYHVEIKGGHNRLTLDKDTVTVTRGGEMRVRVELKPPPLAKGPFDAAGAKPAEPVVSSSKPPAEWQLPPGAPDPATAPFDADKAKEHQEKWAKYLGRPVERDFDLPGGEKLTMVLIPPGEFVMGSTADEQARFLEEAKAANDTWAIDRIPNEGPQHPVRITNPFYLGKYEVTQAQWEAVMGNNPSKFKDDTSHPVEQVSWDDIQPFLGKLNAAGTLRLPSGKSTLTGERLEFALPTDAQWEYVCRAGTTTFWHDGDTEEFLRESGWFTANSGGKTHPVGQLKASVWGLYDMHGNVWEWCADRYGADYYRQSPMNDPSGPPTGSGRVGRGGSWGNHARLCRSALRNDGSPGCRDYALGLRLACEIPNPPPAENCPAPADEPPAEATSYRPPVIEPGLVESFAEADLYRFLVGVVNDQPSDFMLRLLYTEISATKQREQVGSWRIGPGMTRDGSPYEFSVRNTRWFARKLSADEAEEMGISGRSWGRTLNVMWSNPVKQIMSLESADVRIETDDGGNRALVGRIRCKVDAPQRVDYLALVFNTPSPEEGENVTGNLFQYVRPEQLPQDEFEVHIPLGQGQRIPEAGRFYFQAFLFEPQASFYRISNELVWVGPSS